QSACGVAKRRRASACGPHCRLSNNFSCLTHKFSRELEQLRVNNRHALTHIFSLHPLAPFTNNLALVAHPLLQDGEVIFVKNAKIWGTNLSLFSILRILVFGFFWSVGARRLLTPRAANKETRPKPCSQRKHF